MAEKAILPSDAAEGFVAVYPQALNKEFCEEIIAKFEADSRKQPSVMHGRDDRELRSGTMLSLYHTEDWNGIVDRIAQIFYGHLEDYMARFDVLRTLVKAEHCLMTPPLIERIEPGQGFNWHIDAGPPGTFNRFLSFIIYLRDVEEGGETEFPLQAEAVIPEAGALVVFPPFWTHLHRGVPPVKDTKYNVTAFLMTGGRMLPKDATIRPVPGGRVVC